MLEIRHKAWSYGTTEANICSQKKYRSTLATPGSHADECHKKEHVLCIP